MTAEDPSAPWNLELRQRYPIPPERLFTAWSDPELLQRWFMATWGESAELDFRAGGSYRIRGHTPSGTAVECFGAIEELNPPQWLVLGFEWNGSSEDPHSNIPEVGPRRLAFRLRVVEGGSELVFTHEGLASEASLAGHRGGWQACLNQLGELFGAEG